MVFPFSRAREARPLFHYALLVALALVAPRRKTFSFFAHGFCTDNVRTRGETFLHQTMEPLLPSTAIVPPRKEQNNSKLKTRRISSQSFHGNSIPSRVPKLSEILHDNTSPNPRNVSKSVPFPTTATRDNSKKRVAWKAGYYTSLKSQKIIKNAAHQRQGPTARAIHVLETFLSISPERCNAANFVCALTLSAKVLGSYPHNNQRLRTLLYETLTILQNGHLPLESLSVRQLCNTVWAIAKHTDRDPQIVVAASSSKESKALATRTGEVETWDLRQQETASPAEKVDALLDELAMELTRLLETENHQTAKEGELCMAAWAYGVLRKRRIPPGWKEGPRVGALAIANQDVSTERTNQHLLQFETIFDNQDDIVACSEPSATDVLFDTIAWSLLEPAESGKLRLQACKWNELANLVWAFASHGYCCSTSSLELIETVTNETTRRLYDNQGSRPLSRDIAQIVWSVGTLQTDNYSLVGPLTELVDAVSLALQTTETARPLADWSCADIVQLALALAHARLDDPDLLKMIYTEATERLPRSFLSQSGSHYGREELLAWEVSILLWSQARMYLTGQQDEIYDRFSQKAVSKLANDMERESMEKCGLGQQEKANLAWSLTVLESFKLPEARQLIENIFQSVCQNCGSDGVIQLEHAHQLWQALYVLEGECPRCVENVPGWFRDDLQEKWYIEKSRTKTSSARHGSLSQLLQAMGVSHFNEHDEDIDVAIVLKPDASWTHESSTDVNSEGMKVAVEFDGPNHFARHSLRHSSDGDPPRTLGHTVLKYRLLKRQGWTVIRVPYYEYDRIPFWASMERQRYLQRLLKTHGSLRFSDVDVSEYKAPAPHKKSRFD